jgi:hypothetical protein
MLGQYPSARGPKPFMLTYVLVVNVTLSKAKRYAALKYSELS